MALKSIRGGQVASIFSDRFSDVLFPAFLSVGKTAIQAIQSYSNTLHPRS